MLGPLYSGSYDIVALHDLKCQGKWMTCYPDLNGKGYDWNFAISFVYD